MTIAELDPWPITIATYNIHGAVGIDGKFSPERIAQVIRQTGADVVALQEVPLGGGTGVNVLDYLRDRTGYIAAGGPTLKEPNGDFGNAVLSRYPVTAVRGIDLRFGAREPRGALDADLDFHGQPLRIVATHLGLSLAERRHQIEVLLERFDTEEMAVVLLGDINEWFAWGHSLRRLREHFQNAPAPPTFPSIFPVLALDRLWIRPHQRLVQVRAHASPLARRASDHLPLVARIGSEVASSP